MRHPGWILVIIGLLITGIGIWEQHVRRLHFHQVERPHWDRLLFTSRVSFL